MESIREGNIVMARLENGSRVQTGILDVMERHSVYSGCVLCGIGMLKDMTLGYYEKGKYLEKQYPKPMELLSMQGYVTLDTMVHLHVSLCDRENKVFGGHLISATVCNTLELTMTTLDSFSLIRRMDQKSGLRLLGFKSNSDAKPVIPLEE